MDEAQSNWCIGVFLGLGVENRADAHFVQELQRTAAQKAARRPLAACEDALLNANQLLAWAACPGRVFEVLEHLRETRDATRQVVNQAYEFCKHASSKHTDKACGYQAPSMAAWRAAVARGP